MNDLSTTGLREVDLSTFFLDNFVDKVVDRLASRADDWRGMIAGNASLSAEVSYYANAFDKPALSKEHHHG